MALPTLAGPAPLLVPPAPPLGPPGPFALRMRGVVHCHSRWSHDSDGELEGIVQAAQAAALDFVVLTDHYTDAGPLETPRGWYDGVLVLTGAELRAGGGSVLALDLNLPLRPRAPSGARTPQDALDRVRAAGALALIGHAERFRAWDEVEGWTAWRSPTCTRWRSRPRGSAPC
ncbi:MAG: hypothetical protein KatS3mg102_1441 [Planctomycetota bacterium]|nr:MAG: hypothetical protein KatS3mg102_1441 [Planctomycetota bacterium]